MPDANTFSNEATARDYLQKMVAIVDGAVDAIVTIDEEGTILIANPACESLFGHAPADLVGKDVGILMPPPDREKHASYVANYLRTGEKKIIGIGREVEALRKDGTTVCVHLAVSEMLVEGRRLFTGFFRDLSDQKRIERALREREAKIMSILDTAVDAIITIDERGLIESVNPACERLFGYPAEEIVGENVKVLMPPPFRAEHDGYVRNYLSTGAKKIIGIGREVVGRRRDGSTFPMHLAVSEVQLGARTYFTGIVRDITDRVRAERELEQERDRARNYLDIAAVIMLALDADGTVTMVNRRGCELLGRAEDEIVGRDWFANFIPERMRDEVRDVFERVKRGEREGLETYENPILARGGHEVLVEWHNTWLRDEDGEVLGTLSSGTDVTERQRLVRRLIEQESLAKLGEMSTVVAHEVKNPLAGILGATRLLKQRLEEGSIEREICDEMITRTKALNDSVTDILAFARPKKPALQRVPSRALLEDVISLVAQDPVFEHVDIRLEGEDSQINCDVEILKPAVLNILVNAAQAMEGRGTIMVTIGREDCDSADACCRVSIRDSGPGIPADTLARVFEPFFTTKAKGTGLGLSIARRAFELHGGDLSIESPSGGGTGGGTLVVLRVPLAT